mmetsp:Transcript_25822/g.40123  ORF Transcript_25822/g.40123 Transcript_25822/m.40123 type:complete len:207 (+) Transcript_25822:453-1073(+)
MIFLLSFSLPNEEVDGNRFISITFGVMIHPSYFNNSLYNSRYSSKLSMHNTSASNINVKFDSIPRCNTCCTTLNTKGCLPNPGPTQSACNAGNIATTSWTDLEIISICRSCNSCNDSCNCFTFCNLLTISSIFLVSSTFFNSSFCISSLCESSCSKSNLSNDILLVVSSPLSKLSTVIKSFLCLYFSNSANNASSSSNNASNRSIE